MSTQRPLGQVGVLARPDRTENDETSYYTEMPGGSAAFHESRLEIMQRTDRGNSKIVLTFPGSNDVAPVARGNVPGLMHYLVGNDPDGWTTDVASFEEVEYRDLWTRVDLSIVPEMDGLKYTFKVRSGGDASLVRIHVDGHESLSIDAVGDLVIGTVQGHLVDSNLVAYYEDMPSQIIDSTFLVLGEDTYGYSLAPYDTSRTMVIDPLLFSTFLGGNESDYIDGIAVDSKGFIYLAGSTGSWDFPGLSISNESEMHHRLGFIMKLSPDCETVLFNTVLGGNESTDVHSIAVDFLGFIHVTGETQGDDFPVTGNAYQNRTRNPHNSDAFVATLSRDGRSLVYSTYLSGGDSDSGEGIDVDRDGLIYVTGSTWSRDFPVTEGAYQTSYGGNWGDAFVAKIDPSDGTVHYVTYLGGSSDDTGSDIRADRFGNATVAGYTWSRDFAITPEVPQEVHGGGQADGFIAKLNPTGHLLIFSTFIGGSERDRALGIDIDGAGNAFVCGITDSDDLPTTPGAYIADTDVETSSFVCKLRWDGRVFDYVSYTGGGELDWARDIAIDRTGCAYIAGSTCSEDLPTTEDAINRTLNGNCDAFVMKFDPTGSDLLYSSYFGGGKSDEGQAIALDIDDKIIVTGTTWSDDLPVSDTAVQIEFGGGQIDAFLVRIDNEVVEVETPTTTNHWFDDLRLVMLLLLFIVATVVLRLWISPREPLDEN